MAATIGLQGTLLDRSPYSVVLKLGRPLFALANLALGVENLVCAHSSIQLVSRYAVMPVLPFLPVVPWLAYLFGTIWIACSVGLFFNRTFRKAAIALGSLLFVSTLVLEVPKYSANFGDMSLRTAVFEPLAMATIAWLLPQRDASLEWLVRVSRYLLALSLIVFGVDHLLAIAPIAELIPSWIPWHQFWIAFFGAAFIAAGLSLTFNVLERWAAASLGLMFAIWVFTLHLPRVLGFYGIPGAPRSPDEWSSLFIAVALWGGPWALANRYTVGARSSLQ
jgi:uncharacterized membrane protein